MNPDHVVKPDPRRGLPRVDHLLREIAQLEPELPVWAAAEGARRALAEARAALSGGPSQEEAREEEEAKEAKEAAAAAEPSTAPAGLPQRAIAIAKELARPHPGRVVNATGIVLHTNLGRAPLAAGAADAVAAAARGYGDLELDLETGARGQRTRAVIEKLRLLSGAADAVAVNNNAAAVLLVLASLGAGREVIVSRGELVEIGGSFRVPEILGAAGARLIEVGTTNRTHPQDYERAIGPNTGLLLKVHRSNFAVTGFVAEVSLPVLAEIGARHGLPVVEDLGSGTLVDLSAHGLPADAFAPARLRQGADLVCFSGDKLLGGPQAGLVLARHAEHAQAMRSHPLARALRLDKLTLAALDWTLAAHLRGEAVREVPVIRQLLASPETLEKRARALAERVAALAPGLSVGVEPDQSFAGGGSLPGFALAGHVVVLRAPEAPGAAQVQEALRRHTPPVLARVRDDAVVLDPRTLDPGEEAILVEALRAALQGDLRGALR